MKIKTLTTFVLGIVMINLTNAQSKDKIAQAYYFQARGMFQNQEYNQSLKYLIKSEEALGKTNGSILALKAKNYFYKQEFRTAREIIFKFYTYPSSRDLKGEISKILKLIDDKIEKERLAEIERERLRRLAEIRKRKKQLADQAEFNKNLELALQEGLVAFRENGKKGFKVKSTGYIMVPAKYDGSGGFGATNYCSVLRNKKYGMINIAGKEVIPLIYDNIDELRQVDEQMICRAEKNGKIGFLNEEGKTIIPFKYEKAGYFWSCTIVPAKFNGKFGYIDARGNTVINFKYDEAGQMINGYARIAMKDETYPMYNNYAIINEKGEEITGFVYNNISRNMYMEDLIRVWKKGKSGFLDKNAEIAIPFKFLGVGDFHCGLAKVVDRDGKVGFINKQGELAIDYQFQDATDFSENIAAVKVGHGKWRLIDTKGAFSGGYNLYEEILEFINGMVPVMKDDKWGYADKYGTLKIPMKFKMATDFDEWGKALIQDLSDNWYYIDKKGNRVSDNIVW